jgi:hypothetical protein
LRRVLRLPQKFACVDIKSAAAGNLIPMDLIGTLITIGIIRKYCTLRPSLFFFLKDNGISHLTPHSYYVTCTRRNNSYLPTLKDLSPSEKTLRTIQQSCSNSQLPSSRARFPRSNSAMQKAANVLLDAIERKGGRIANFISKARGLEEDDNRNSEVLDDGLTYNIGSGKLHDAIKAGNMKRLNRLLEMRACDLDEIDSRTGYSGLHVAAMTKNKAALVVLLKHGAELLYQTKMGNTCLHCAVDANEPLIVRKIVESAFQRRLVQKLVAIKNRKFRTCLDVAESYDRPLIVELIQSKMEEEKFVFAVEQVLQNIVKNVQTEASKHTYGQGRSALHFLCLVSIFAQYQTC